MMLAVAEGVLEFFTKTRIGNVMGLLLVVGLALMAWTHHVSRTAAEHATTQVVAKVEKATDQEHDRRIDAMLDAQKKSQAGLAELKKLELSNNAKLLEIDNASRANDARACLPADAVDRLRDIGPGQGR